MIGADRGWSHPGPSVRGTTARAWRAAREGKAVRTAAAWNATRRKDAAGRCDPARRENSPWTFGATRFDNASCS